MVVTVRSKDEGVFAPSKKGMKAMKGMKPMSKSQCGRNQSDDRVEQLIERVDELEATVADQDERIDELEARNEQLRERVDELEDQPNVEIDTDEKEPLSTLTVEGLPVGRRIAGSISEYEWEKELRPGLEADLGRSNPTPESRETTIQQHDLTPIEQLSRADDPSEVTDSPTVERAISLFQNIAQWGSKTPKGIVLKPADNPLSLLETDREESLAWKQYYRACETLEQLSEGSVTFFDSDRHGKMLVLHSQSETYERVANGALTPSTVETTT